MRNLIQLLCACILFSSCKTLQLNELKNPRNTKSIGIEWTGLENINPFYKERLVTEIERQIAAFNAEPHTFSVHIKEKKEKDYITIDFMRGKLVSKGEKIAGYIVTGLGMAAIPVTLVATEGQGFLFFYWLPANKLNSSFSLSPSLSSSSTRSKRIYRETNTFFANTQNQGDKLVGKFGRAFHQILEKIHSELQTHR